ncbi:uncharacterized protein CLUP02_08599 [Colletotrichum lupini]|uniref:Uncharacterized protein n=1 Tax=Colletotrichum lupini TaxID=145971 RepID=A0A9Q8WH62_9PEZI|nr:uncharacterized protein CLUP02_08599 [Colletotrichum lupini]UQC83106.1 hypothetical protein CLUP02_08599 [Colletotrichum lupini]
MAHFTDQHGPYRPKSPITSWQKGPIRASSWLSLRAWRALLTRVLLGELQLHDSSYWAVANPNKLNMTALYSIAASCLFFRMLFADVPTKLARCGDMTPAVLFVFPRAGLPGSARLIVAVQHVLRKLKLNGEVCSVLDDMQYHGGRIDLKQTSVVGSDVDKTQLLICTLLCSTSRRVREKQSPSRTPSRRASSIGCHLYDRDTMVNVAAEPFRALGSMQGALCSLAPNRPISYDDSGAQGYMHPTAQFYPQLGSTRINLAATRYPYGGLNRSDQVGSPCRLPTPVAACPVCTAVVLWMVRRKWSGRQCGFPASIIGACKTCLDAQHQARNSSTSGLLLGLTDPTYALEGVQQALSTANLTTSHFDFSGNQLDMLSQATSCSRTSSACDDIAWWYLPAIPRHRQHPYVYLETISKRLATGRLRAMRETRRGKLKKLIVITWDGRYRKCISPHKHRGGGFNLPNSLLEELSDLSRWLSANTGAMCSVVRKLMWMAVSRKEVDLKVPGNATTKMGNGSLAWFPAGMHLLIDREASGPAISVKLRAPHRHQPAGFCQESQSSRPRIGAYVRHKLWNNLVASLLGAVPDPSWFQGSIGQSRPTCELQASVGCRFSKVSDINDHGFSEERRATSAWSIKSEKGCVRRETLDCTGQGACQLRPRFLWREVTASMLQGRMSSTMTPTTVPRRFDFGPINPSWGCGDLMVEFSCPLHCLSITANLSEAVPSPRDSYSNAMPPEIGSRAQSSPCRGITDLSALSISPLSSPRTCPICQKIRACCAYLRGIPLLSPDSLVAARVPTLAARAHVRCYACLAAGGEWMEAFFFFSKSHLLIWKMGGLGGNEGPLIFSPGFPFPGYRLPLTVFADPTLLELPSDLRNDYLKLLHTEHVSTFPYEGWMDDGGQFEWDARSIYQREVSMVPFDVEDDFECAGSILLLRGRPGQSSERGLLLPLSRVDEILGERSMSQVIRTVLADYRLGEVLGSGLCCIATRGTHRHLHFAIQYSTSTTYLGTHSPRNDVDRVVGGRCLCTRTTPLGHMKLDYGSTITEERSRPGFSCAWEKLACGQQIVIQ